MIKAPKKLIEVALPLDDINVAAAREKSIRHGHPSTLHLWWARRPLAAARAVLFAQLVNDPGGERGWGKYPGQTKEDAQKERERLFDIIRELVKWENTNNETVLEKARKEIRKSWQETCDMNKGKEGFDPDMLPAFHDPFAGGGAIPLEAQRLGLESYASDLNPVAVMINKAMIEIPPKFAGRPPVNPEAQKGQTTFEGKWTGAKGLAEDVRYYGQWMRDEAFRKIGHLYPTVEITEKMAQDRDDLKHMVGQKLTVIAWIWARTVKSPNPAFAHVDVPLVKSFVLSAKKGKEAWLKPVINGDEYHFEIKIRNLPKEAKEGTKLSRGANFKCILSDSPIDGKYIKAEGVAERMGQKLLAVVAEGQREKIFLPATNEIERIATSAKPEWIPTASLPDDARNFWTLNYGLNKFGLLFTSRQLVALNTFSNLIAETREKVIKDAKAKSYTDQKRLLHNEEEEAQAYGDAIAVYLAFAVDRSANYWSSLTPWGGEFIVQTFGRQAIPMVWDFAEGNPFSKSTGNWTGAIEWISKCLDRSIPGKGKGLAIQANATNQETSKDKIISTDPPYYDNISYADLSDYFYVWMRKALKGLFNDIFSVITTPKEEELIASPYRHGNKDNAEKFFLEEMKKAMGRLKELAHASCPITIYYAFKQDANIVSIGWESFLDAIMNAGLAISGTWPLRTERDQGLKTGTNVLASSIILVCRKRPENAATISRRDFLRELKETMPEALEIMIGGKGGRSPIQPADLAQAAIGPGMAVYSKYASVLEADGSPMRVRDALIQINREIDAYFNAAEGDLDADTRFCIDWFMQYGFKAAPFGEADVLARAKGTSVDGVAAAGVVESGQGKVQLLSFADYPSDWDPQKDRRNPVWESTHHLIRALRSGGEAAAGKLLAQMRERTEPIRQLAYRLFTLCERKNWAEEALAYNELISSWPGIVRASEEHGGEKPEQTELF
ncbi:MAG: DUF1156 domain-containing protein [Desulfobacterales bacterium]|nr:DUF1156 domain-containing protein [Desulfobacterales bacterium]